MQPTGDQELPSVSRTCSARKDWCHTATSPERKCSVARRRQHAREYWFSMCRQTVKRNLLLPLPWVHESWIFCQNRPLLLNWKPRKLVVCSTKVQSIEIQVQRRYPVLHHSLWRQLWKLPTLAVAPVCVCWRWCQYSIKYCCIFRYIN